MNRFDRALAWEMVMLSGVAFAALTALFEVVVLVRMLGRAVAGDMETTAVLPMLGFAFVYFLPTLLAVALFVGIFMSLSRLWRDSEAVIWMGAGIGPWGWMRPVLLVSVPTVLLIAFASLDGRAWAALKQAEYERVLQTRDQISTLSPGMFAEDRSGQRVYFVERVSRDGLRIDNIFAESMQQGRLGVVVAQSGRLQVEPNGDHFLVMENGKRYDGTPGETDFRLGYFRQYAMRIQPREYIEPERGARLLGSAQLLHFARPAFLAEFVERIGTPISALLLALLAVPLSYTNPRAGRSPNVVFAILIYLAYNNVIGLSRGWVEHASLTATQSLLLVHGVMLAILLYLYRRRFSGPWDR